MKTCRRCGDVVEDDQIAKRTGGKCKACKAEIEKAARDKREVKPYQSMKVIRRAQVHGSECRLCTHEHSCGLLVAIGLPILCENIWQDDLYRLMVSPSPTPPDVLDLAGLAEFVTEKGVTQ